MRRLVPLALAVSALALASVALPSASAAAADTCGGVKTQITGSGEAETFRLNKNKRVINFPATVCMGSGNDILRATGNGPEGVPVRYLDGGKGFDTAVIYICFEGDAGPKWTLRDVERLTVINCQD
jgi:hypothetical protein